MIQPVRIALVLLLFLSLWPANTQAAQPSNVMPAEVIVKLAPGMQLTWLARASGLHTASLNRLLTQLGAGAARPIGVGSNTYRIYLRDGLNINQAVRELSAIDGVVYAEPNAIRTMLRTPNDPIVRQQWALRNIQAYEAWDITTGGEVVIAILDTGTSSSHPDLRGNVLKGYDFYNNDGNADDDEGHGTYTAGVAAAKGDNGEGIAGVCWNCKILPVKVLGSRGQGDDATIAMGIRWAADQGARIISMSLGGDEDTQVMRDAVIYAKARGALLLAASGNGQADGNKPAYPAAYPEVVAVSATDGSDTITGFSTYGDFVALSAPGVGVWSTSWSDETGNSYDASNGTSAACPYVAGIAALVLTIRPELNADQLTQVLIRSADDRGAPGKDPQNGYGRVNALRALQLASDPNQSFNPPPSPPPATTNPAFAPISADAAAGARYFPETGHSLRGTFRAYWEKHGGLPIFGFPISEEFTEPGENGVNYRVQYFERHRLELHPENTPPYDVLLSRLGNTTLLDTGRDWNTFAKTGNQPGCRFFAETGQSICGNFLRYWRANGLEFDGRRGKSESESLALFGLPLSPPQVETLSNGKTVTVQWFERARFEDHGSEGVLLGLLAGDLATRRGWR
jgi:thermitase